MAVLQFLLEKDKPKSRQADAAISSLSYSALTKETSQNSLFV